MSSLNVFYSNFNSKINFNGEDLSTHSGLFLIKEFTHKIVLDNLIKSSFKASDDVDKFNIDDENLLQKLFQIMLDILLMMIQIN